MAENWWNSKYFIRRNITFKPDSGTVIEAGYPLFVRYDYVTLINSNKLRSDLADIQVLYIDRNLATPSWVPIPRNVYLADTGVYIQFNAVEKITTPSLEYYVYMGNPTLSNTPVVDQYVPADYIIDTSAASGLGLTYTRPNDDWVNGISQTVNAKATFVFYGVKARLAVQCGPDRGIIEIQVDNNAPFLYDCYRTTESQEYAWTASNLLLGKHYVRMRATGDKNPSSSDSQIEIVKFMYSRYTQGIDGGEEIYYVNPPMRILVGP